MKSATALPSRRNSGWTRHRSRAPALARDDAAHRLARAGGDGRFRHHDGIVVERAGHLAQAAWTYCRSALPSSARVGVPTAIMTICASPSAGEVGGVKTRRPARALRATIASRPLVDRNDPGLQLADLLRVLVDAGDGPAGIGETGAADEADIARPDHGDPEGRRWRRHLIGHRIVPAGSSSRRQSGPPAGAVTPRRGGLADAPIIHVAETIM